MKGPISGFGDYQSIPMPGKNRRKTILDLLTPDQKLMLEQIEKEEQEEERNWEIKRQQQRAKDQASILTGVMDMFAQHPLLKTAMDNISNKSNYTSYLRLVLPSVISTYPDATPEDIVAKADLIARHSLEMVISAKENGY